MTDISSFEFCYQDVRRPDHVGILRVMATSAEARNLYADMEDRGLTVLKIERRVAMPISEALPALIRAGDIGEFEIEDMAEPTGTVAERAADLLKSGG